ncbi:hypothetical protein [Mycobacterium sp.]|uniref:hypothetical protein n=1 Tax=Mycobacterium sp. TaxID=1785 RepID=UPI003C77BA64
MRGGPSIKHLDDVPAEVIGKAVATAEYSTALDVAEAALLTTNADALALLIGGLAANMPLAPRRTNFDGTGTTQPHSR